MNYIWILLLIFISTSCLAQGGFLVGGLSSEKYPTGGDPLQHQIIPQITPDIYEKVEATLTSSNAGEEDGDGGFKNNDLYSSPITVLSYKTQVVAGTNYFVKARIGKLIFHLRIYEDFRGQPELTSVKGPMRESDPIEYF